MPSLRSLPWALAAVLLFAVAGRAVAHGGVGIDDDPCVRRAGLYLIHFAAYQPQVNPTEEYCDQLPKAEHAIFVFDLVDRELRDERATVAIHRATEDGAAGEALHTLPAQRYPTGVVNTEFRFDSPGEYLAVVTLEKPERVIRFPLRVEMWSRSWIPLAGLALLVGIPFGYFAVNRLKRAVEEGV